jgi:hypothetical protein
MGVAGPAEADRGRAGRGRPGPSPRPAGRPLPPRQRGGRRGPGPGGPGRPGRGRRPLRSRPAQPVHRPRHRLHQRRAAALPSRQRLAGAHVPDPQGAGPAGGQGPRRPDRHPRPLLHPDRRLPGRRELATPRCTSPGCCAGPCPRCATSWSERGPRLGRAAGETAGPRPPAACRRGRSPAWQPDRPLESRWLAVARPALHERPLGRLPACRPAASPRGWRCPAGVATAWSRPG